jgi:hypothetical protein
MIETSSHKVCSNAVHRRVIFPLCSRESIFRDSLDRRSDWEAAGFGRERQAQPQSARYTSLDGCATTSADGAAVSRDWNDHTNDINPSGVAKLFARLASSEDLPTE